MQRLPQVEHLGPTLLLTRPKAQADRFADQCHEAIKGIRIEIAPILEIAARPLPVNIVDYDGIILTSENGARAIAGLLNVSGVTAWCVGDRTAQVAQDQGMNAVSAGGSVDDLVKLIIRTAPKGRIFHAHGKHTTGDLNARLCDAGINIKADWVYDQIECQLGITPRKILRDGPVVLPIFSPRSAQILNRELPRDCARLAIVALSRNVAAAFTQDRRGQNPAIFTVAERPDAAHMIDKIATIWATLSA